jgi:methionyl-tRNA synthetase
MELALSSMNLQLLLAATLWSIPWKAWALWLAARRGDLWWFLIILIISTLGLLEMVYIFLIAKQRDRRTPEEV